MIFYHTIISYYYMQTVIASQLRLRLLKLVKKLINLKNQKRRTQHLALYNKRKNSLEHELFKKFNNKLKTISPSTFKYSTDCNALVHMWNSVASLDKDTVIMVGVAKSINPLRKGALYITNATLDQSQTSQLISMCVPIKNSSGLSTATSLCGINITTYSNGYTLYLTGQYTYPYNSGTSGFIFFKAFTSLNEIATPDFFTNTKDYTLNISYPTVSEYSSCDNNVKMISNNYALGVTTAVFTDGEPANTISWIYTRNLSKYIEINFTSRNTTLLGNKKLYNIEAQDMVYNELTKSYTIIGSATDYTTPAKRIVAFIVDAYINPNTPQLIYYRNLTTFSYKPNIFSTTKFNGLSVRNNVYDFAATAISKNNQVGFIGTLTRRSTAGFAVSDISELLKTANLKPVSATGIAGNYVVGNALKNKKNTVINAIKST